MLVCSDLPGPDLILPMQSALGHGPATGIRIPTLPFSQPPSRSVSSPCAPITSTTHAPPSDSVPNQQQSSTDSASASSQPPAPLSDSQTTSKPRSRLASSSRSAQERSMRQGLHMFIVPIPPAPQPPPAQEPGHDQASGTIEQLVWRAF